MIQIISILKSGNKTVGADILDLATGNTTRVSIDCLVSIKDTIRCINGTIVSSGYIRSKPGFKISTLDISNINKGLTVYHGSRSGISGNISAMKPRAQCDFGLGFYTGYNKQQAQQLILGEPNGILYKFELDIGNLDVYKFENPIYWALFVAYNRGKITTITPKLLNLFKYISKHDVIIGNIADDRMNSVFPSFFDDGLTDKALIECLSHIKYGKQAVLKTDKACKNLNVIYAKPITEFDIKALKVDKNNKLKHLDLELDNIRKKYLREGKYFSEILQDWR